MRLCASLLALTACVALTACDNPEQKEAKYIKHGNLFLANNQPEKARIEYKNAAKLKPTDAEPFYRLGTVDEAEGDLRNAFGNFYAAEQQNKNFYPAVLKVAQYYIAATQYEEAHRRIEAALAADPHNAEAHALLAAVLLREKKFDDAEKEAKTALNEDPANISACSALTGIYAATGDNAKAVAAVEDGIARNPDSQALLMLEILLYEHMENLPKVEATYHRLFKLKPKEIAFRNDLAELYVKAGKLDEAEAALREGVKALPDNWDMKHALVLFLADHRSVESAEQQIKELMQSAPDNGDLAFWLADLYASHGQADRAIDLLQTIVAHAHDDAPDLNARTLLARLNISRGNRDAAEKMVTDILAKNPDNQGALFIRASLAFDNGYYQSAVSDLRTLLRDAPKNENALQLMAEALLLQGHLDLAIDTMKRLCDADPVNFAARVRLAQMEQANGDHKQAMNLIGLVTQTTPDYALGWESAARLSIEAKDWLLADAAIKALDKIDGQHLTASFLQGQLLDQNGKSDEAIAKYSEVISADPATPLAEHALVALMSVYQRQNHLDKAAAYLQTLTPASPAVLTMLGKCYANLGKLRESAAAFDKAIAGHPDMQDAYLDRAKLYIADHNADMAIDVLKDGWVALPADFRAPMMQADLLGETGKQGDAVALYENMLARNPQFDAAANNLAEVVADDPSADAAALEKARQIADRFSNNHNPLLVDTLAWVYYRQGNIPQALTLMERVTSNATALPPQVLYHYGAILMKAGRTSEAKEQLVKATANNASYPGVEEAKKLLTNQ